MSDQNQFCSDTMSQYIFQAQLVLQYVAIVYCMVLYMLLYNSNSPAALAVISDDDDSAVPTDDS